MWHLRNRNQNAILMGSSILGWCGNALAPSCPNHAKKKRKSLPEYNVPLLTRESTNLYYRISIPQISIQSQKDAIPCYCTFRSKGRSIVRMVPSVGRNSASCSVSWDLLPGERFFFWMVITWQGSIIAMSAPCEARRNSTVRREQTP